MCCLINDVNMHYLRSIIEATENINLEISIHIVRNFI